MDKTKFAELEAVAATAKQKVDDSDGTDESLNSALTEADTAVTNAKVELEAVNKDIDFGKELETLEANTPPEPAKRTEKEKAQFTIDKIHERFPDLKGESAPVVDDDKFPAIEKKLLRNQVEGIFRANSKSDDEVKYKMFFYDNRIAQTGNIHDDADNAEWLANKGRTKNAIEEMKRNPNAPENSAGAGQKSPSNSAPTLPPQEVKRLLAAGLKQVAPDRWEGEKVILQWDSKVQKWNQTFKS